MQTMLKWIGVAVTIFLMSFWPDSFKAADSDNEDRNTHKALAFIGDTVSSHFADGGGWTTEFVFINMSDTYDLGTLYFYDNEGNPQFVNVKGNGSVSSVEIVLQTHGSLRVETLGAGRGITQGSAVFLPENPLTHRIAVSSIFRSKVSGIPTYEASVPFANLFHKKAYLPFDHRNGFLSGIAIVNNSPDYHMFIKWDFYNEEGVLITSETSIMGPREHEAFSLAAKFPELADRVGMMVVSIRVSAEDILGFSLLGLRFHPDGPFTTITPRLSVSEYLED